MNMGIVAGLIKALAPGVDPQVIEQAVTDWLDDHPEATTTVEDGSITEAKLAQDVLAELGEIDGLKEAIVPLTPSATSGDVGKFMKVKSVSGGKVAEYEFASAGGGGSVDLFYVTPEDYGAVGDGETDDSQAVQDACDAGYAVYFASNKTYYIPTAININHDCHLFGGENTVIKTETVNGYINDVFVASGTLKKTTTLTTDYDSDGKTANAGNQFTLSDMTGIAIDDIMVITATDQYYNYSRQYYYLGGTLLIGDIYNGHLYATTNLPFDIENTENVSVKIYSAPQIIIENLEFIGEMVSGGNYKYFVQLTNCRNSIIRNCRMSEMDSGIRLYECFNTLIESVEMAKAKELNTRSGDSYGVAIYSSTNTVIDRVNAICAQSCVCISGDTTNINTYVKHSTLCSECRPNAFGSHENAYNTVLEDCTLTGANILGTGIVNRCRFIRNNRINHDGAITFCGSHNPKYATLKVSNCVFEADKYIYIYTSEPQNPIQAFDNIIGLVEVMDCEGGAIAFEGRPSEYILSNRINELRLERWKNCKEVYRPRTQDIIGNFIVNDCSFKSRYWISDHNDNHGYVLDGIENLDYKNTVPMIHKVAISKETHGMNVVLPENTPIQLSSENTSAKFVVTGKNIVSNNVDDYMVGFVTGNEGGALARTEATGSNVPTISIDSNGNVVFTQKGNTGSYCVFPVGMVYAEDFDSNVTITANLKNTGATSGSTWRAVLAVVKCETGKIEYRGWGTAVEATAQGASISHTKKMSPGCVVLAYFYCSNAVENAVTTFEDVSIDIVSSFVPASIPTNEPYTAVRRTGDGTLYSVPGVNHIMSSEPVFNVNVKADYTNS